MKYKKRVKASFIEAYRKDKAVFFTYFVLRAIVIAILVLALVRKSYENAFTCVLVLLLFLLPDFVEKRFKFALPSRLEIIILLFIFCSEILGELQCYYVKVPHWDTAMHTLNGFVCAAFGYSLVDLLNRSRRFSLQLSPLFLSLVAFCFSMTVGVLWEFFEFGVDRLFDKDMQKDTVITEFYSVTLDETNSNIPIGVTDITSVSVNGKELGLGGYLDIGLYDTMKDMFVNFIGAVVFSTIGFFEQRYGRKKNLINRLVPTPDNGGTDANDEKEIEKSS